MISRLLEPELWLLRLQAMMDMVCVMTNSAINLVDWDSFQSDSTTPS